MKFRSIKNVSPLTIVEQSELDGHIVEIEQKQLLSVTENICNQCRYPLLTLRLLNHVICGIDADGRIRISARRLSKALDVHYDTVTKCLKYLRETGILQLNRN